MSYTLEMSEQFHCPRSAEEAFDYITDFSRIDEWDHTIVSAEKVSSGAIGVGSTFELLYAMGPRRVPIAYEITAFEPHESAILIGKSKNFTATDTVTITANENGCHVDWHASIEFTGVSEKVIPLIKNRIVKAGRETIQGLAEALEDKFASPSLGLSKKLADKLVLPGLAGFTKFGYSIAKRNWKPTTNSVKNKHVVITGATSGLGLATAHELAHRGAELTLVARNKEKAVHVAASITAETGNTKISIEIADLGEITDVISLAERLLKSKRPIDVLINNAGALLNSRYNNADGIEASFALLLLSPVILTEKLKPLLKQAGTETASARVINVSSGGMYAKRISNTNLESTKGKYRGADAYARSKRGLVMAGEYWAEHWQADNIVVQNMHPGWAQTPGVENALPEFNKKMQRTLRNSDQGADTIIWLACATEAAKTSGMFWLDREPHSTHLTNKTRETAKQRQTLFDSLGEYAMRYDVSLELGD